MYLGHVRVAGVPPFGTMDFPFRETGGTGRMLTVVHGSGGVGKTTLLGCISLTRPGHAVPLAPTGAEPPHVTCEWMLGQDDPERPHPLMVASPNAPVDPADAELALRRREQALFDKRAKEGGYVFLVFPSIRYFSRQPVALHAPARTVLQYDVRGTTAFDDPSRCDLTRETKQALAYAAIAAALSPHAQRERNELRVRAGAADTRLLGSAMRETVDALVRLTGFSYAGLDPLSFEPTFVSPGGRVVLFDGLPTRARHLVAFAALTLRTLWAAYPGRDPRTAEGVIAIDDVDVHQDESTVERLCATLRIALPFVQWILTTSSTTIAASCDARDVLTLRRLPEDEHVELFMGEQARTH